MPYQILSVIGIVRHIFFTCKIIQKKKMDVFVGSSTVRIDVQHLKFTLKFIDFHSNIHFFIFFYRLFIVLVSKWKQKRKEKKNVVHLHKSTWGHYFECACEWKKKIRFFRFFFCKWFVLEKENGKDEENESAMYHWQWVVCIFHFLLH